MKRILGLTFVAASGLALMGTSACTTSTQVRAGASYSSYGHPHMVWVEPGVWVMTDSAYPIFYTDGYYWLHYDGYWYSSTYYWGGWVYAPPPRLPVLITRVGPPRRYIHYAPRGRYRRQVAPVPRQYRTVDHRRRSFKAPAPRRSTPRSNSNRSKPKVRDHRRK